MEKTLYRRVLNPFRASTGGKYKYRVFFVIEITQVGNNPHPYFSIWGVHGPLPSGNCMGSCGQNLDDFINDTSVVYEKGWNPTLYQELIDFWKQNHLKTVDKNTTYYYKLIETAKKFPESNTDSPWNLMRRVLP